METLALPTEAILGRREEERFDLGNLHPRQRSKATPRKGLGKKVRRPLQSAILGQEKLGDIPMRLCPGENPAQGWLINEDMQDRVVESGVAGVTVSIPVPHIEVHLDRSPAKFAVHLP
jgi:hypothetical protein